MNRCAVAGLVLSLSLAAQDASAAVIAFWRFEPGALTVDSSGNGYTLTNTGATSSGDVVAPGSTGSALFAGGGTVMGTSTPLNFTGVRQLRMSWWHKFTGNSAGLIFETTTNFNLNPGAFIADVFEESSTTGEAGVRLSSDYNLERYPHAPGTAAQWDQYSMDINLDATNGADVVRVFRNGVLQADAAAYGLHSLPAPGFNFLNAQGFIGARASGGFGFVGNIDELKLESVPEPSSLVLASCGLLGLGILARRRRTADR